MLTKLKNIQPADGMDSLAHALACELAERLTCQDVIIQAVRQRLIRQVMDSTERLNDRLRS